MKFVQFVGLWTLANHPSRAKEWSLSRKVGEIKKGGFGCVCARLDSAIAALADTHGLSKIGMIFPDQPSEFAQLLRAQKDFGAGHVTVQLGSHDTTPAEAVKRWLKLEQVAEKLGVEVSLETHRDSVTETPEKLFELADRYEKAARRPLTLTWDFSHLCVVKHLHAAQFVERLLTRPELVQHATHFHFRPFNSHHAQLPVTHRGELTPETRDYLDFAQEVIHIWKAAPQNREATLFGCPSLGPKGGYALTHFPPVWPDALVLSSELQKRWQKAR